MPDGTYAADDFIDDDGINDRPIRVSLKLTINSDRAIVDLTGCDAQAEGNTNSTLANTYAAVYYVMIAMVDPHMPPNSGCYRPIEIITRPGSVVHPLLPGAVAARTNCSQKIVEAMLRALAPVLPDRVVAGGHAQITTCAFGGRDPKPARLLSSPTSRAAETAPPICRWSGRAGQPFAALHEHAGRGGGAAISGTHRALRACLRQRRRRQVSRQPGIAPRYPRACRPGKLRALCRSSQGCAARLVWRR